MTPISTAHAASEAAPAASSPILVVDDHAGNLLAVEAVLAPLGHRIVQATSGRQALRRLLEEDFAVILLDVMMPELDGFETAKIIRQRERSRTTPIIFLSAISISHRDIIRGYAEGGVDYLTKPFDPEVLRAKVDIFVELHRNREEIRRQAVALHEVGRVRDGLERNLSQTQHARAAAEDRATSYRVLAERIPQQVWTSRPDGALDYVNPVVLSYFAQSAEAILGAGWQSVIHPDDRPRCVQRWTASLSTGADYEVEFRLRHHDGSYRWHLGRASAERDARGQISRWFGTNTDIDDRKRAEATANKLVAEETARIAAVESEDRIRQIVESIAEPMFILDAAWRVEYLNAEGADLLALPQSTLIGRSWWELFPQAPGSASHGEYLRARRDGVAVSFEDHVLDGWFEIRAYPTRDGRLCAHFRTIDARKLTEAKLARENSHTALRADIGTALSHKAGIAEMLRECTEALVRHLGVALAQIWTLNDATNTLELEASAGRYAHRDGPHGRVAVGALTIGRIAERLAPHVTNDVVHDPEVGDPAWAARTGMVAFAGYPLVVDRRCIGVVAMFAQAPLADDTLNAVATVTDSIAQGIERHHAERALEQRAEELARSNAELERFAYVASHDLQEPLRMVASYTQLLRRRYQGKLDAAADEFIGFAVDGATRMQALINDLLTFSRVGTRAGEPAEISLERPLASAIANLAAAIGESGAIVTHDPLPSLRVDQPQIVQLFQNLVGNAIKFRAAAAPVIHIGAQPDAAEAGYWQFSVRDNGIGIAGEFFDRLFVLFQRLHTRTEYPGNGIGLAICKKIVERHGGRIWVESEPGAGTTFRFTLRGNE